MSVNIPRVALSMQLSLFETSSLQFLSSRYLSYPVDGQLKKFMMLATVIYDSLGTKPDAFVARGRTGRPRASFNAMFLASVARCFFQIPTTKKLVGFLGMNGALREFCGFTRVPSEATFSRFLAVISERVDMDEVVGALAKDFYCGSVVGNICRDSTTIAANDKAIATGARTNKDGPRQKRGRKKKGSPEEHEAQRKKQEREESNPLSLQASQSPEQSIACLNKKCAFGAKTNAKGVPEYAKGYKAHIDVTDNGIPTAFVITGANVHDSRVSIPLEQLTSRRVTSLYTLSDSGYYSEKIDSYIASLGKVPLTDPAKRRKAVPFAAHEKLHFKTRTTVERTNSQMKLYYLPAIFTHGYKKFKFVVGLSLALISTVQMARIAASKTA